MLPTGDTEPISLGDTVNIVNENLPAGFKAVSLNISQLDNSIRNIFLTVSVSNASLLDGGEIRCDDTTRRNAVMAGCLIDSELINILI